MTARLIAISGALKGMTFALTQDEVSIGRDLSNIISINDPSISRQHCIIRKNGSANGSHIVDLKSYNGTFVNGLPVVDHALSHRDEIALGDLRFTFLTHDDTVTLEDGDLIAPSTIRLKREQAFYLRPENAVAGRLVESLAVGEPGLRVQLRSTLGHRLSRPAAAARPACAPDRSASRSGDPLRQLG